MNKLTFIRCLKRIRKGDMSGLQSIYDEYHEKLIITGKRILHKDNLAEDAVSDTYLNIIRYAQDHEHPRIENPGAYLFSVIKNSAYKIFNEDKKYIDLDSAIEYVATDEICEASDIGLEPAMEKLNDIEFKIIEMHYFYGYKLKEISLELDIPLGTIKWKLVEIRKRLLKIFEK